MPDEGMEIKIRTSDLASVKEAADALCQNIQFIYRWIKAGKIVSIKMGDMTFIPRSEIERLRAPESEIERVKGKKAAGGKFTVKTERPSETKK